MFVANLKNAIAIAIALATLSIGTSSIALWVLHEPCHDRDKCVARACNKPIGVQSIKHPLEPLTAQEVQLAVSLLKDQGKVTPTTRFVSVSLKEPNKDLVHRFKDKEPIRREAFAVLFDNGTNSCFETTLSLTDRKILSWKHIPGVQPTMTMDEQIECEQAVLASPEFKAALKKYYGIEDTKFVMVDIWSAGNYGLEEDRTKRLARPLCFLRMDPTDNGYAKPIEGLALLLI